MRFLANLPSLGPMFFQVRPRRDGKFGLLFRFELNGKANW